MVSPRLGCRPNGTGDQTRLASLTLRPVIRQPSPQAPRAMAGQHSGRSWPIAALFSLGHNQTGM